MSKSALYVVIVALVAAVHAKEAQAAAATNTQAPTPKHTCDFEKDFCGWTNQHEVGTNAIFQRRVNVDNVKNPPIGCFYITPNNNKSGSDAVIDSPVVAVSPETTAVQVNFSYWIVNNQSAKLHLLYVPLDTNVSVSLWETIPGQESSTQWNLTTVYLRKLPSKLYKLVFHGVQSSIADVVAVKSVAVTELSRDPKILQTLIDKFVMEKPGDQVCSKAGILSTNISILLTVFVFFLAWQKQFSA